MFFKTPLTVLLAALGGLVPAALAHPGEKHDRRALIREVQMRSTFADVTYEALSKCENAPEVQARKQRAMERRLETFQRLRAERGISNGKELEYYYPHSWNETTNKNSSLRSEHPYLHRRTWAQFNGYAAKSHNRTGTVDFTSSTPNTEVFGANSTCILTPDNVIGPYYVLGEQIRSDIVEDMQGIPLHLEVQFVDVNTCQPEPDLFIDIWHCNAVGVYSGVSAAGQGGLQSTFLRGVQKSSADGVVEFDTIFPGHYVGRATHQHMTVHVGATQLPNNTYSGGTVAHISQIFFDEALIQAVERTAPYNTNTVARTLNTADFLNGYSASASYDPFPEYVQLDANDLSKGLFMWIEIGINPTADYDDYITVASIVGPNGGSDNPNFNPFNTVNPPPTHG
jgi:protocatechuate 3,4-dioxygenase beta subunit